MLALCYNTAMKISKYECLLHFIDLTWLRPLNNKIMPNALLGCIKLLIVHITF